MRHRSVVEFGKFIGAAGLGAALGLAVAGLAGIVTGESVGPGSSWLGALPMLSVFGIPIGVVGGWLSRRWFVPCDPARPGSTGRRVLRSAAAGLVLVPLIVAAGQMHALGEVATPLMLAGSIVTLLMWTSATPVARPDAQLDADVEAPRRSPAVR